MFTVQLEFMDWREGTSGQGLSYENCRFPCLPAKGDWVNLPDDRHIEGDWHCDGGRYEDASFSPQLDGSCTVTLFVAMVWEQFPAPTTPQ